MIMKLRSTIGILISVSALTLALALTGCNAPESAPTPASASESISALRWWCRRWGHYLLGPSRLPRLR